MIKRINKEDLLKSYNKLENKAIYDLDYILLIIGATVICSFGFRMNSPSVIVGAMVISPILFVVVGMGATLFWKKWKILLSNLLTLFLGIVIAIIVSFIINKFFPASHGSEIVSRITSSRIDYFMVALFSGLTGTFAFFWPDTIEAIAGIAISVALIPPVVMIGLGLASSDILLTIISVNITLVNIVGIFLGSFLAVVGLNFYVKNK